MREDLIQSAVSFLTDPKVQSAELTKKVSFLESKGMTSEEIEEAMSRANGKAPSTTTTTTVASTVPQAGAVRQYAPAGAVAAQPMAGPPVPARPSYDWRDVFIAAVLAGGATYGLWTLAKRVFGPWFKVPSQDQLEKDKEALDAQFQAVEESLKDIKDQTEEALTSVSTQSDKVNDSLNSLEAVLEDLKKGDEARKTEFNHMMDRNKEAQNAVLEDLQNELKSLKSLIVSRRPAMPEQASGANNTSNSPVVNGLSPSLSAALNGNNTSKSAGIPAWQMAATKSGDAPATSAATT
ncbi:peroxisomal membrane anchor protein conserved region-domain-containing protein, partial [Zychaea mexicana]|uniref:peroxisomal membrane anchor protein conserved region-domain-containing protein n=1 Tax=Zychaea mexicana TaxID=64656 RepID=UPI0022FED74E